MDKLKVLNKYSTYIMTHNWEQPCYQQKISQEFDNQLSASWTALKQHNIKLTLHIIIKFMIMCT